MVRSKWTLTSKEVYPHFIEDDQNRDVIKLLILYIMRDERFEKMGEGYSLNKGILLHGNYGTGKTILLKILQRTLYYLGSPLHFRSYKMRHICMSYHDEGPSVLYPECKHWLVDEFGLIKEQDSREKVNSYGNKITIGDELIGVRYDLFQARYMTHLTTNLTRSELQSYYTGRTYSRLQEMVNFVPLDGKDRRPQAKPAAPEDNKPLRVVDKKQGARDWWRMIIRQHSSYKETGKLKVMGPRHQFELFERAGLILLDANKKKEYMAKARALIVREKGTVAETRMAPGTMLEYRKIKSLADAINNKSETIEQTNELISVATSIVLQDYYDAQSPKEFEQLVNAIIEKI